MDPEPPRPPLFRPSSWSLLPTSDPTDQVPDDAAPATSSHPSTHSVHPCRLHDQHYTRLNKISEGTYGKVFRAVAKVDDTGTTGAARDGTGGGNPGGIFAVKQLKHSHDKVLGYPLQALREISTLLECRHENIIRVHEVVVMGGTPNDKTAAEPTPTFLAPVVPLTYALVMDYVQHELQVLLQKHRFSFHEIRSLVFQLCSAVAYLLCCNKVKLSSCKRCMIQAKFMRIRLLPISLHLPSSHPPSPPPPLFLPPTSLPSSSHLSPPPLPPSLPPSLPP